MSDSSNSQRPLRITHIKRGPRDGSFQWGGAETAVRDLADETASRGHSVQVIAPRRFLEEAKLRNEVLGTASDVMPRDLGRLVLALHAHRSDVVVLHTLRSIVLGGYASALAGVPARVTNLHNSPQQAADNLHDMSQWRPRAKLIARRAAFRSTMRRRRYATIAISPSMASDLARYDRVPPKQIVRIDNWVVDQFRPLEPAARQRVRAELGVRNDERMVLYLGRFEAQKDPLLFVRLAALMPLDHHGFMAGDGPLREAAAAESAAARITFLGHRTDAPVLFGAADVIVVPSLFEGFGRVAVEALASGTRVVASDVAGLRDSVGGYVNSGVTLVNSRDPQDWVAPVVASAQPEAAADRAKRHAAVSTKYSLVRAVDEYVALYRELLADA